MTLLGVVSDIFLDVLRHTCSLPNYLLTDVCSSDLLPLQILKQHNEHKTGIHPNSISILCRIFKTPVSFPKYA
jgi:hypothetical protein